MKTSDILNGLDLNDPNKKYIEKQLKFVDDVEKRFNSSTFCSAKWLQSTIALYNGYTHSCHHPPAHKIQDSDIDNNPAGIHNTSAKIATRRDLLSNIQTSECSYCWNIENLDSAHLSDRHYKTSNEDWSAPYIDQIYNNPLSSTIIPPYLEIAFDSTCNFKCAYCSPDVSSKWMEEIEQFGSYPTSHNTHNLDWLRSTKRIPIPNKDFNPYVDAFWKWWPELSKNLKVLRITGGEPLLSKHTWRLLENLLTNPHPSLTLVINTNMDVPDEFINKLIYYKNALTDKLCDFQIYTSCETHGVHAEYSRFGMNYGKFISNIEKYLSSTDKNSKIAIMSTMNALSIQRFDKFLSDVLILRAKFNNDITYNRLPISINYLYWPPFLRIQVLPYDILSSIATRLKIFSENNSATYNHFRLDVLYLEEIDQIHRLTEFMLKKENDRTLSVDRQDFVSYITEYDRRRKTNYFATYGISLDDMSA